MKSRLLGVVFGLAISVFSASAHASLIPLSEVGAIDKPTSEVDGRGIAFLGSRMFYSGFSFSNYSPIYELSPDTGAIVNSFDIPDRTINGLAANPLNGLLYFSSCCGNVIEKVDPTSGSVVGSVSVEPVNMQGLAISNDKLYAADNDNYEIYEIDISTGATLRSLDVSSIPTSWGNPVSWGNIQGIEVFNNTIFLNIDNAGGELEIHEFDLTNLSHIGVGYTGQRAAGSGYDGEFLWIDIEGQESKGLIKLAVVPVPAAIWLLGVALLGLLASARRKKTA